MKLTKDDFDTYSMSETMKEQIIKNQEDAEKWNSMSVDGINITKLWYVWDRLKKRIEEVENEKTFLSSDESRKYTILRELQKILGEKK